MQLTRRILNELSNLQYKIFTCPFEKRLQQEALIVAFEGEYGNGSKGNGDALFMTAIIKAALAAWDSVALILDLRAMMYEWGDLIGSAVFAGADRYFDAPFPTSIVISDRNREGMTSFMRDEVGQDPQKWLFDSLEEALRAVEEQLQTRERTPTEPDTTT